MARNAGQMVVGGVILSLLSVGFIYAAWHIRTRAAGVRRIEKEGVTGEAVVARRYTRRDDEGDTSYHLELVLPYGGVDTGMSWGSDPFGGLGLAAIPGTHVDRHVSAGFYQSVSEGQRITVRYLPDNPYGCIIAQDVAIERIPWFAPYLFIGALVFFWGVFIRGCVTREASGPSEPEEPGRRRGPVHSSPDD